MKKRIAIILGLLSLTYFSFSQARLGHTAEEITTEFSEYYPTRDSTEKMGNYLNVDMDFATVLYVLGQDDICYICYIIPDDIENLNGIVENYNNKYVIVSDFRWKFYQGTRVSYIDLLETEDHLSFFKWYFPE